MNILDYIPAKPKKVASTRGGEWHGPCPFCGGEDRFRAQPERDFARCRRCEWSGDTIQLLRDLRGMSYAEACEATGKPLSFAQSERKAPRQQQPVYEPCRAPSEAWQARARYHAERCAETLWKPEGEKAMNYLLGRGLSYRTIEAASFGFNPSKVFETPEAWGLDGGKKIFLPRGITIPWVLDGGEVWNLRVRRALPKESTQSKYISPRGCSNALYNADYIQPGVPVLLVEGEIDAWSAAQEADGLVVPVATGGTCGARRLKWSVRLSLASVLLVAFDHEEAGEDASRYWLDTLPNAIRWRPYWADVNSMLQDGASVREWIEAGLKECNVLTETAQA